MKWLFYPFKLVWKFLAFLAGGPGTPPPVEEPEPEPEPLPEPPPPPPPPVMRESCVDMSNWWVSGPISDAAAITKMMNLKQKGYVGVIAGTQVPSVTNQQVKAALTAGLWTDVYHYVDFKQPATQVSRVLYAVEDVRDRVNVVWLDLEEEPPASWETMNLLDYIATMMQILIEQGFVVGIYTRRQWWVTYMKNMTAFGTSPLWCTDYDNTGPFHKEWWERNRFGGWSGPIWVQYSINKLVAGMNVDINERYVG